MFDLQASYHLDHSICFLKSQTFDW